MLACAAEISHITPVEVEWLAAGHDFFHANETELVPSHLLYPGMFLVRCVLPTMQKRAAATMGKILGYRPVDKPRVSEIGYN
jgi:hypothetical protein